MNRDSILGETIRMVLDYFGVHKSVMERDRSYRQRAEYIFVHFKDRVDKKWVIAFIWEDANCLLDDKAYAKKVYDLAKRIILDFIQQGAKLEEHIENEANPKECTPRMPLTHFEAYDIMLASAERKRI